MGKLDFQHCFFLMHTLVYDTDLSRDVIEQLCAEEENGKRGAKIFLKIPVVGNLRSPSVN